MSPSKKRRPKRRHRVISTGLVIVIVILLLAFRLVEEIGQEKRPMDRFTVVRVIDGDTVELAGGDRLRLLGIDTPEKGERFYDRAKQFLGQIALGKTARLEYADVRRDRYGRLLGFLYIDDSIFANQRILDSGFGNLYLFNDNDNDLPQFKSMLESQKRAVSEHKGIWGLEQKREKYYVASKNSYRFHRPDCKNISGSNPENLRKFDTKEEALDLGLSPCRNCRP